MTLLDRGTGNTITNPSSPVSFSYSPAGSYTGALTIANADNGAITTTCYEAILVTSSPVDGMCGTASGAVYY